MVYSFPPINETDISGVFIYVNNVSNGFFGLGILITIFVVSFLAMQNYQDKQSFAASMFVTAIAGTFLWSLEIISDLALKFCLVGLCIAIILLSKLT